MTSERRQFVRRHAGRRGGAFSLIEVMLGVLILALGLLGLAALMPAVVAQQRNASNTTLGVSAMESAMSFLMKRPDLNVKGTSANPRGLGEWFWDTGWSNSPRYLWAPPIEVDDDGLFRLGSGADEVIIPVRERLWPSIGSGRDMPIFVWDLLARRVAPGSDAQAVNQTGDSNLLQHAFKPEIELVVFVRRIDSAIRPTGGSTIWEAISGPSQNLVAVGEDEASGLPTLNGTGIYSRPKLYNVEFNAVSGEPRNMLELKGGISISGGPSEDTLRDFLARPGQKIVDNLGNIYSVVGLDEDNADFLIIDPPVPQWVADSDKGEAWRTIQQVAFTLQVPAAVQVFRLPVEDPKE